MNRELNDKRVLDLNEIRELFSKIYYKENKFEVVNFVKNKVDKSKMDIHLTMVFISIDSLNLDINKSFRTYFKMEKIKPTERRILERLYKLLLAHEIHELKELFQYNEKCVINPHKEVSKKTQPYFSNSKKFYFDEICVKYLDICDILNIVQ